MTEFLLIRHGKPDYSHPAKWNTIGWGADLAPLSKNGILQIQSKIETLRAWAPQIVICSSMTRALQSALVICSKIHIPCEVEFDLHEWVPDRSFQWQTLEEVLRFQQDYYDNKGECPINEQRTWESLSHMRGRACKVLRKYSEYERVLVVCHGMLIESLANVKGIAFAGTVHLHSDAIR